MYTSICVYEHKHIYTCEGILMIGVPKRDPNTPPLVIVNEPPDNDEDMMII
jgi:hypothetical protein